MTVLHRRRIPLISGQAQPPESPPDRRVSRRAALQSLAGSLGVALTAPTAAGAAAEHPVGRHVAQRSSQAVRAPRAAAPAFLDPHQFATLAVAADLIVPGAAASESPRFIDDVLAIEHPDVQQRFVGALGALDAAARERHQQSFRELPRDRQTALLQAALTAPYTDAVLSGHVNHLKTWVAGAHYSSEAGMKELGWTGAMFFPSFPGCTHSDGHE
jgi:hypothetical protein